jgi:L-lactate dehydrogenase (cytochrome)
MKIFTRQEVSKHPKDEVWVVINNMVYNLTEYIKQHPGGKEVIMSK